MNHQNYKTSNDFLEFVVDAGLPMHFSHFQFSQNALSFSQW